MSVWAQKYRLNYTKNCQIRCQAIGRTDTILVLIMELLLVLLILGVIIALYFSDEIVAHMMTLIGIKQKLRDSLDEVVDD